MKTKISKQVTISSDVNCNQGMVPSPAEESLSSFFLFKTLL